FGYDREISLALSNCQRSRFDQQIGSHLSQL
ncbi:MAG: hypothetical protein ACI9HY_003550, partial [Planctomycetaceae bacterium]